MHRLSAATKAIDPTIKQQSFNDAVTVPSANKTHTVTFLPLDEAIASRTVIGIVVRSVGRADRGRNDFVVS